MYAVSPIASLVHLPGQTSEGISTIGATYLITQLLVYEVTSPSPLCLVRNLGRNPFAEMVIIFLSERSPSKWRL